MKKKNKSIRNNGSYDIQVYGTLHICDHAIKRYALRLDLELVEENNFNNKNTQITRKMAIDKIINEVRMSKLIHLFPNKQEERIYKGNKYILERTPFGSIKVVTMKITQVTQKELFADKFHGEVNEAKFRDAQRPA